MNKQLKLLNLKKYPRNVLVTRYKLLVKNFK